MCVCVCACVCVCVCVRGVRERIWDGAVSYCKHCIWTLAHVVHGLLVWTSIWIRMEKTCLVSVTLVTSLTRDLVWLKLSDSPLHTVQCVRVQMSLVCSWVNDYFKCVCVWWESRKREKRIEGDMDVWKTVTLKYTLEIQKIYIFF